MEEKCRDEVCAVVRLGVRCELDGLLDCVYGLVCCPPIAQLPARLENAR